MRISFEFMNLASTKDLTLRFEQLSDGAQDRHLCTCHHLANEEHLLELGVRRVSHHRPTDLWIHLCYAVPERLLAQMGYLWVAEQLWQVLEDSQ